MNLSPAMQAVESIFTQLFRYEEPYAVTPRAEMAAGE
jgi:hypothetical protein